MATEGELIINGMRCYAEKLSARKLRIWGAESIAEIKKIVASKKRVPVNFSGHVPDVLFYKISNECFDGDHYIDVDIRD